MISLFQFKKTIVVLTTLVFVLMASFFCESLLPISPAMATTQDSVLEKVTLEEIFQYLEQTEKTDVTLKEIFQFLDKDGDFNISEEDVSGIFSDPCDGGFLKNSTPEKLVEDIDSDQDGYISVSELKDADVPDEIVDLFFQGAAEVYDIEGLVSTEEVPASTKIEVSSFIKEITSAAPSLLSSCGNIVPECGPTYCQAVCYGKGCSCSWQDGCPGCMTGCSISCSASK
ncbi:MAG: hypothetical protein F6K39_32780 [Okeania sp. SIO3B3]|nr:hypothetical protein [Okeania sp. SIO3B3]